MNHNTYSGFNFTHWSGFRLLALGIILTLPLLSYGQYQFPDKAQCEQLKSRKLAVRLFDESFSMFNDAIKKAFDEQWKVCPVEYVSQERFDAIKQNGETGYAVVFASDATLKLTQEKKKFTSGIVVQSGSFTFEHFDVFLSLVTAPGKLTHITAISFCNSDLIPSEFYYAGLQLNRLVTASLSDRTGKAFYDAEQNIAYIKSKKFYLPKELFKEEDLAKVSDKYDYPVQVGSLVEMNDLVLAKDTNYVYPKIIWSNQHRQYGWITVDMAEGAVRSFMGFAGLATGTNEEPNKILKPAQLRNAVNGMMQKVNNKYD